METVQQRQCVTVPISRGMYELTQHKNMVVWPEVFIKSVKCQIPEHLRKLNFHN